VPVAHELALADLLVGRVFPVGDGTFRLSPAITGFRDPGLLSAVRTDVERLRRGRRGVLRIEQIELERLFFDTPRRAAAAGDPRAAILAELAATGLAEDDVADIVHAIETAASAAAGEDAMTELLNRLAFDTSVDLGRVRVALIELRALAQQPRPRRVAPARRAEASASVAAALAKFDEGRAAGADLEALFRELESDLGVDASDDEDVGEAPDFPGVVGAMVEEFLWELERERGDAAAAASAELRLFGRYAEKIGVYENLGARDLLDFAARWLLDEGEVHDAERAARILEALRGFCLWSEERHAHPLWSSFAPLWSRLRESLPRIAALRARAEPAPDAGTAQEVLAVDEGSVELKVPLGRAPARTVTIEPSLAAALRPGDLVRLSEATGAARLAACYPPELKELLASKGSGPRS
jgi:hypothetical protein